MCVTTERLSNICGHKAVHTKVCKKKAGTSLFNVFRAPCKPTKSSANYFEICHDCRLFWESRGISELAAQNIYRMYRDTHQYYGGGLSPHEERKGERPTLVRDGELENGESPEPQARKKAQARRRSCSSSITLWPTVDGDSPGQDTPIAPPEDFEMHNIDQAVEEDIIERGRSVLGDFDMPSTRRKRVSEFSARGQETYDIGDEYIPHTNEFINPHRAFTSSRGMIDPEVFESERLESPQDENGFETVPQTPAIVPPPRMPFPNEDDQNQIWRSF